ncbi:hypothetical protein JCM8097_003647 [Rhodosporidiobolus ruineniae]
MRLLSLLAFALPALVSATYFTSPTSGAVWDTAAGQTITWHYQAGGARTGDIVLQSTGTGNNPKNTQTVTLASNVDLTSGTLAYPAGVGLRSSSQTYYILMVNSASPSDIYTQVGPLTIQSFDGSIASTSAAPTSTSTGGAAVGNGSGGASSDAGTNPAVSSATPTSTALSTLTVIPGATSSATPSSRSSSSSSDSSPSPSSSAPPVTSTVFSTASGVVVTSFAGASSSASSNVTSSIVTVTLSSSASPSSASLISASMRPSSAAAGGSNAASGMSVARWMVGAAALVAGALVAI